MMHIIEWIFGEGKDLTALNMGCRAVVLYFVTLALIRVSGMRTFGQQSSFDTIVVISVGALLSRTVVGASPFFPTVFSGFVLAIMHRYTGAITLKYDKFRWLFKGEEKLLYKDGKIITENMKHCMISEGDLMANIRLHANVESLSEVKEARMERTGQISVVRK